LKRFSNITVLSFRALTVWRSTQHILRTFGERQQGVDVLWIPSHGMLFQIRRIYYSGMVCKWLAIPYICITHTLFSYYGKFVPIFQNRDVGIATSTTCMYQNRPLFRRWDRGCPKGGPKMALLLYRDSILYKFTEYYIRIHYYRKTVSEEDSEWVIYWKTMEAALSEHIDGAHFYCFSAPSWPALFMLTKIL